MHRTHLKNIQIFAKSKIQNFSDFARYNKHMENTTDPTQPDNWAMKIFSEFCCDSCMCKNEHKKRPDTVETESGLILDGNVND